MSADSLIPSNENAEKGVLGCLILDCEQCLPDVESSCSDPEMLFHDIRHREVFRQIAAMSLAGDPVTEATLGVKMSAVPSLKKLGGVLFMSELIDAAPVASNLQFHLRTVLDCRLRRDLRASLNDLVGKLGDHEKTAKDLVSEAEQVILSIGKTAHNEAGFSIKADVTKVLEYFESATHSDGGVNGLKTGFADLDRKTGGLHEGKMYVLAARPSLGKSSLAMNIAETAMSDGVFVHVFSLEMPSTDIVKRLILARAKVDLMHIRDGTITERDVTRMVDSAGWASMLKIHIDDTPGISINQIRSRARRISRKHGTGLIVVDYIQLASGETRKGGTREQEVSSVSRGMKEMAKELSVPVIALSQLNRAIEKEKNRSPRLSDLKESGSIEQDADLIWFLHNPQGESDDPVIPVDLIVAKHRDGGKGPVPLTFFRKYTRFESRQKIDEKETQDW